MTARTRHTWLGLAMALASAGAAAGEELKGWTHYMASPARTGSLETKGIQAAPKVRWTFPSKGKYDLSNVVVADALVYMVSDGKLRGL